MEGIAYLCYFVLVRRCGMVKKRDVGGNNKSLTSLNEEDYFAKLNEQAIKKIKSSPESEKKDTEIKN